MRPKRQRWPTSAYCVTVGQLLLLSGPRSLPGEWKFVDLVVTKWTMPPQLLGVSVLQTSHEIGKARILNPIPGWASHSPELGRHRPLIHQAPPPDSLSLTSDLCLVSLSTGGKGYGQESGEEDYAAFRAWLQCYGMAGMSSLRDRHGRTIWFQVWALMLTQANRNRCGGKTWGQSQAGLGSLFMLPRITLSLRV